MKNKCLIGYSLYFVLAMYGIIMKKFALTAEITISLYTEVEAETLEEAIEIAEERDLMTVVGTGGETKYDTWMSDELDGMPENITEA